MQKQILDKIKYTSTVSILLCFLFLFQIMNKVVFVHSHQLESGKILIHAHPYDKTTDNKPYKEHRHTTAELLFFEQLKTLFPFILILLTIHLIIREVKYYNKLNCEYVRFRQNFHLGRSPPVY